TSGVNSVKPFQSRLPQFRECAAACGIDFTYYNGDQADQYSILETPGGGVAIFDFDNDGHMDVLATGGGEFREHDTIVGLPAGLFQQQASLRFKRVDQAAHLSGGDTRFSHGAAVADFDNDGFSDVLVTGYGGVMLHHNLGDGTFEEISEAMGFSDALWSASAAWGDFNGDGNLDVYVAHYLDWSFANGKNPRCESVQPGQRDVCPPRHFVGLPDTLFQSTGGGPFQDNSVESGIRRDKDDHGKGLAVVATDLDLDGDVDIYVANDAVENFLYRNEGKGVFTSLLSGAGFNESGVADGSMGIATGDLDLDGLPEIWVTNFERDNFALYKNQGDCLFAHASREMGVNAIGNLYVGWGTVFLDADNDGFEDIFSANGHTNRHPLYSPIKQKPLLLENERGRRLHSVAHLNPDLEVARNGRGVAAGDLDDDGDVDLVVSNINEPLVVLINEAGREHHWLALRLIGTKSNRDAVGATVFVTADGVTRLRQVQAGASYASTNDPRLFFGLGSSASVEHVEIRWPSGLIQKLGKLDVDRQLTIVEGDPSP
ncbi:MAG: CRTAC1 family protein, partial [Planctomycetota bacterium]|nr:CRTAC1 family protein [Planctomycetota bacterium]